MHMMACSHCGNEVEMDKMDEHMKTMHPDKKTHTDTASSDTDMSDNMGAQNSGSDEAEKP